MIRFAPILLLTVALNVAAGCSVGCEGPQKSEALRDTVQHYWTFRDKLIYANPRLTREQKVNEIHLLGAALNLEPAIVEKDLDKHLKD